jgi:hypothetical protein
MPLRTALLKKLKQRGNKTVAQCPACAEDGGDKHGQHLVIYADGRFGCVANPGDRAHRRRIAELAGDPTRQANAWTIKLRGKVVMASSEPKSPAVVILTSLARENFKKPKPSEQHPSETSDTTQAGAVQLVQVPDTDISDGVKTLTRIENRDTQTASTTVQDISSAISLPSPSVLSEDIVAIACRMFGGRVVTVRDSPRPGSPHLAGWRRSGQRVYLGTEAQWNHNMRAAVMRQPSSGKHDPGAWLAVAQQVETGEYEGADRSTVEGLVIGLRGIPHPLARRALEWLRPHSATPQPRTFPGQRARQKQDA